MKTRLFRSNATNFYADGTFRKGEDQGVWRCEDGKVETMFTVRKVYTRRDYEDCKAVAYPGTSPSYQGQPERPYYGGTFQGWNEQPESVSDSYQAYVSKIMAN